MGIFAICVLSSYLNQSMYFIQTVFVHTMVFFAIPVIGHGSIEF